mmetsp:Transcript_6605/g.23344  ORF Transcript_6605/g.23344 Transcript_6605/m.23344 type:complete len:178 (-) Transcript_6605:299-832(-)
MSNLESSAPSRVVVVSSSLHQGRGKGTLQPDLKTSSLDELRKSWSDNPNGMVLYKSSKLANILFAFELNRRLKDRRVTCNALSPGFIPNTGLSRNQGLFGIFFMKYVMAILPFKFIATLEQGATCIEYVATAEELEGIGGNYYAACKEAPTSELAKSEELQSSLWRLSESMIAPYVR